MPKFRLKASYGFAGTEVNFGVHEYDTEEDAQNDAWAAACEKVDSWAERVSDDEETD